MHSFVECVCVLNVQVHNLEEEGSDEGGLLPVGSAGAYGMVKGLDLKGAKSKDCFVFA